jgi:type IV secretion system protein VirB6
MIQIVDTLLNMVDGATENYVTKSYQAVVNNCMPMMITAITIYIAWIGWKTLIEKEMSAGAFIKHTLKIAVIFSLTTNWDFFSLYFYKVLTNGPNELAGLFLKASDGDYSTPNTALQKVLELGIKNGVSFWEEGGVMSDWLPFIFAMDIWICVAVLTAVAVVFVAMAKIFLALLIVLAPVFLYFIFSDTFKGTTDAWFRNTLGWALVPMMVSCALLFTVDILDYAMTAINDVHNSADLPPGASIAALILFDVCMLLCVFLIVEAKNIAIAIAGGLSVGHIPLLGKMANKASLTSAATGAARWARKKMGGKS